MEYLIEKDRLQVETCFGYWLITGESYKECFSPSTTETIDDEELYMVCEYKAKDELYNKCKKNLPCAFTMLFYTIVPYDSDCNTEYELYYKKYNTSSPFALFLCNQDYTSFEEEENEDENKE